MKADIRILIILLSALFAFSGTGFAQKKKRVEIVHCDSLDYNDRIVANAQRLMGNVHIKMDGVLMWCDSLYSYTNNNMVDAFGRVHIIRGDTLDMYADFINYNGDTKFAKARRNVKLIDKKVTLTTDSLDYTMITDMASYNYSGTVKDTTNVLNSLIGQYYVNERKAYFRTNVHGVTKDYKIKSDTL
ncbi:MAG: OstA-like protein, partial [Bacteroidota bacterium]|nr:OstA-like protein [Bacteroidota bacterium]